MTSAADLWEHPEAKRVYMLIGWRQWADAGSISSGLPKYLIEQTEARQIGTINADGFYLYQIPGTHDLVRPVVSFEDGFPASLDTQQNDISTRRAMKIRAWLSFWAMNRTLMSSAISPPALMSRKPCTSGGSSALAEFMASFPMIRSAWSPVSTV